MEKKRKKTFSAVSVNKYIEITTEAVVASAKRKRKCRDGGEGGESVTTGEDRS